MANYATIALAVTAFESSGLTKNSRLLSRSDEEMMHEPLLVLFGKDRNDQDDMPETETFVEGDATPTLNARIWHDSTENPGHHLLGSSRWLI